MSCSAKNSNWIKLKVGQTSPMTTCMAWRWCKNVSFPYRVWLLMFNMFVVMVTLAPCKSYCYFFIYWFRMAMFKWL